MQVETPVADSAFFPIILDFRELTDKISDDKFESFCRQNPDAELEMTKEGELVIMPPTGGRTGNRNFSLIVVFGNWLEIGKKGIGFDSSTVFKLPNGAKRSPDLAWIKNERWENLTAEEQEKFPPICPDFVVGLRSKSDSLKNLQDKMKEHIENGAALGWLIDPLEKKVHVYRPDAEIEILDDPKQVSGEPLLKGFALNVRKLR